MLKKYKNPYLYFIFLFVSLYFFIIPNQTLAATINFSQTSSSYNVGDTIKVKVIVSSDKSINAVSSKISFSSDILSLTSLSKSSSLINLWAKEPSFSNNTGIASFEGIILNGYIGNAGNIITLVFKAKSSGVATIRFNDVSILANDGNGTEVYNGELSVANINISKAIEVEKKEVKTEDKIEVAIEKIKEVEYSNDLPNNSLLITIIIVLLIIINLIIIFTFFLIYKLRKHLKNKLTKTEALIDKNFGKLEEDIDLKIFRQNFPKSAKIRAKEEDIILDEVIRSEQEIIKEIERVKKDL